MQGLSGGSSARVEVERLQGEVAQRDRIIGELTVANSVLKNVGDFTLTAAARQSIKDEPAMPRPSRV